jgi:acetylglutamate kinase
MPAYTTPPAEHDFQIMAERALDAMPERLSRHVRGVAIMIDDIADEETLAGLGIDNPWELTGLYRGIPLTERSVADSGTLPDAIFLYREAILVEWIETGEDLYRLVASVLVHEIAHHFGFSDADIDRIEAEMDPLADGGG